MKTFKQYFTEVYEYQPGEGLDTSWSDEEGETTISIKEVLKYLDKKKVEPKEEPIDKLKAILIKADRDSERVKAANLDDPVVVVVDKRGKWKSILDGNHRVEKVTNPIYKKYMTVDRRLRNTLPVRELDLRTAPEEYRALFDYEIETDENI